MKTLMLLILLATPSLGGEYERLAQEYNLFFQASLAARIQQLPARCFIRVSFKNRPDQVFRFERYTASDDALWVSLPETHRHLGRIFAAQAFAIQELQAVRLVEPI